MAPKSKSATPPGKAFVGLGACALLSLPATAHAHAVGLSAGDYTPRGESLHVELAFARSEIATLLASLDSNHDGHITAFEVEAARKDLEAKVLARVHVMARGQACAPFLIGAALSEKDGLTLAGQFACPTSGDPFDVDVALLDDLPRGHRHVARAPGVEDEVLYGGHARFSVAAAAQLPLPAPPPPAIHARSSWAFFMMGLQHILTGYDHLVFLFALVLPPARIKELLATVTAFTLAHSLTLAVAALGIFTPSPRLVEPAIALSIAYVGAENFFVKDGSQRWRVTFPFGLIHGFGFASAFALTGLARAQLAPALLSFNLGVEAGQIVAMSAAVAALLAIRQGGHFGPRGVRVLSAAVVIAGCVWCVVRIAAG